MIKFTEHDVVVTAYAQPSHGPGWSNQPVWVIIKSRLDGSLREECLQPHEQSREILMLYRMAAVANDEMTSAVRAHLDKLRKIAS